MGFFIRHLHRNIEKLHHEQQSAKTTAVTTFQVYRGQGLSIQDFEKMKQTKGGLMSFNNFLSTSCNRDISLENFARPAALDPNSVGILFVMTINPTLCATSSTPFVKIKNLGFYDGQEEEILFSTHTIFRIHRIQQIHDGHTDRLWQVNLTFTGNNDNDLDQLAVHMRKELSWARGWPQLGHILIKVGEYAKAEQLYQILLAKASSNKDRANYNYQLGWVYDNMGEYS
ncbi:unnamed protein product [Rotaria sp. Silwood1]|nr:unnamed protein product [Rotaria sp. Silwood1]